jgi:uncharacterized protein (DUF2164 family)
MQRRYVSISLGMIGFTKTIGSTKFVEHVEEKWGNYYYEQALHASGFRSGFLAYEVTA